MRKVFPALALCLALAACSGPGARETGGSADDAQAGSQRQTAAASAETASVSVTASGFRNDKGTALFRLFATAEGFPGNANRAFRKTGVPISSGTAAAKFENLPPGNYAVSLAHDEDASGAMTYNTFGIPLEGSGSSGKPRKGVPRFDDAKFDIPEGGALEIEITVKYFG